MSRFIILFVFISAFGLTSNGQNKILFDFPFDGSYNDNSQFNHSVNILGNIKFVKDRFGNYCSAAYFNGSSYIEVKNNKVFNSIDYEFSVSGWFKFDNGTGPNKWLTILCKGEGIDETKNNPHFRAQIFQSSTQSTISINTELTEYDPHFNQHIFTENQWFFYVVTYNGDIIRAYLNGDPIWEFAYNGKLNKNNSPLFIGMDSPGAEEIYKGSMDELKLYNYVLSKAEIKTLYKKKSSISNIVSVPKIDNLVFSTDSNNCSTIVHYYQKIQSDCVNDSVIVLKGLRSGSRFNIGETKNVLKVIRNNEEYIILNKIIVKDNISPIITCVNDTTIFINDSLWTYEEFNISYSDNCKLKEIKRIDHYSKWKEFPIGDYTLEYDVSDISNNHATCMTKLKIIKTKANTIPKKEMVKINDEIITKDILNFSQKEITITIYDNKIQDGDRINVFFNQDEIVHNYKIKSKKKRFLIKTVTIDPLKKNNIVVQALNMGSVGKNTIRIDFYEGHIMKLGNQKPLYSKTYDSEPGRASAIWLNYK